MRSINNELILTFNIQSTALTTVHKYYIKEKTPKREFFLIVYSV